MPVIVAEAAGAINTSLVNELIALVKSAMGLFTEYPLNVLLISSLVGVAFVIFRRAKGAAR